MKKTMRKKLTNAASEDHGDDICNDKTSDKDEVM